MNAHRWFFAEAHEAGLSCRAFALVVEEGRRS
jgi:hypothetical protein